MIKRMKLKNLDHIQEVILMIVIIFLNDSHKNFRKNQLNLKKNMIKWDQKDLARNK